MPLSKGTSREAVSASVREFHRGETYARTAARYGRARADAQAVAAALSARRRALAELRKRKRKGA